MKIAQIRDSRIWLLQSRLNSNALQAGIFTALLMLNLPLVYQYLGSLASVLYAAVMIGFFIVSFFIVRFSVKVQRWLVYSIIGLSLLLQVYALIVLSPQFHGRLDRDSAILTWLSEFGQQRFPYAVATNRGNPISVLPFMPVVALPAALLGNVGYLEIASYVCLTGMLWRRYRYQDHARSLAVFSLSFAPLLFFEVLARSDLIVNSTLLVLLLWWLHENEQRLARPHLLILGIGLGCLLATRLALLPSLAMVGFYLLRRLSPRALAQVIVSAVGTAALLLVPFALWDSPTFFGYAPLGVNTTKLGTSVIARISWPLLTGLVVLLGGYLARQARDLIVLQVPLMAIIVAATWFTFFLDLTYLQLIFIPLLFAFPDGAVTHSQSTE